MCFRGHIFSTSLCKQEPRWDCQKLWIIQYSFSVHCACTLKLMHGEKRNAIAKRWLKIFNVSQFISSLSGCHIYGYFHWRHCFISCRFSFVVEGRDLLNLLLVKKLLKHSTSTLGNKGWCFLLYFLWLSIQENA